MISVSGYNDLLQVLEYDKERYCFYWKISPMPRVKVGDVAGCKDGRGYYCVRYKEKLYPVHKLVWLKEYGFLPTKLFIDHINTDRGDNRKENLRLVDRSLNSMNRQRFDCDETKTYANISLQGKGYVVTIIYNKVKNFFGPFPTKNEALVVRDNFIKQSLDRWKELVFEVEGFMIP